MGMRLAPRRNPYKVFNPTWIKVETAVGRMDVGQEYVFEDGEEVEVYDQYHAKHIEEKHKGDGLVLLDYDKAAEAKYGSYELYKTAKGLEGLKNFYDHYKQALDRELTAKKEATAKGSHVEISNTNVPKFEKILKQIEEAINLAGGKLDKVFKEEQAPKIPSWLKKEESLETKVENNVKITDSGRVLINGKFASKQQVEELGIEPGGNKN